MKGLVIALSMCLFLATGVFAAPSTSAPASVNRVVAVVNGEMITKFDLDLHAMPDLMRERLNPKNPAQKAQVDEFLKKALEELIVDIIAVQECDRLKISVSEADVTAEVEKIMSRNKLSKDELVRQLKIQGVSYEDFTGRIRKGLRNRQLFNSMVGRKVFVSPEEVKDYYAKHKGMFTLGKKVNFAILVYPPNEKAEVWASRISKGQAVFEDVARKMSVGPHREKGGAVGLLEWDQLEPNWREKLENLKVGEVSQVFIAEGLKAQVKLLELDPGQTDPPFEAVAEKIEDILREPKLQKRYEEYKAELRKRARVEVRL